MKRGIGATFFPFLNDGIVFVPRWSQLRSSVFRGCSPSEMWEVGFLPIGSERCRGEGCNENTNEYINYTFRYDFGCMMTLVVRGGSVSRLTSSTSYFLKHLRISHALCIEVANIRVLYRYERSKRSANAYAQQTTASGLPVLLWMNAFIHTQTNDRVYIPICSWRCFSIYSLAVNPVCLASTLWGLRTNRGKEDVNFSC